MKVTSLFLDMENKNVLIVGTGQVGIRRARRFLDANARVSIVTHDIDYDIKREFINKGAKFHGDDELDNLIKECDLVIAATDNQKLNKEISLKAKDKLVNCASDISLSNVIVPSTFNIGSVTVSLYTDSKSPLMARQLRKKIQSIITETDILNIELQEYVRTILKKEVLKQEDRKKYMTLINEDEYVQELLNQKKLEEAEKYVDCLIKKIN